MSDIKDKLYEQTLSNVEAHTDGTSIGIVIEADESNNRCYIYYINHANKLAYDYAEVKLSDSRGSEWFPLVGQMVDIQIDGPNICITGENEHDFQSIKPRFYTAFDIYPSATDNTYGGYNF